MPKKKTYYDYLRLELGELVEQLEITDLHKQTLKQRWLDQVVWADKKASESRRWHYRLRLTTIVGGVILPALVGINFEIDKLNPAMRQWFPYLPFALSQVIAVSAAIEEFCRFGDRWRDYRQMSEDLKAEGWQYLQLSGSYENTRSHMQGYALFASRVESIIKNDVQNYITDLIQQQAKQEQQIEKYLESAQAVAKDKTLFAAPPPPTPPAQALPPGAPGLPTAPGYPQPGYPQPGYPQNGGMGFPSSAPSGMVATLASYPANPTAPMTAPAAGAMGWLRAQHHTVFKLMPQASAELPDTHKVIIPAGSLFGLQAYQDGGNQHLYVTLTQGVGAEQRNVWYVYIPHVELLNPMGQPFQPMIAPPPLHPPPQQRRSPRMAASNWLSPIFPKQIIQKIPVAVATSPALPCA